jgi:hypothetical protein
MKPVSEVFGEWPLTQLPASPASWMKLGQFYSVVLRRRDDQLPEVEVRNRADHVLAKYTWRQAIEIFTPTITRPS